MKKKSTQIVLSTLFLSTASFIVQGLNNSASAQAVRRVAPEQLLFISDRDEEDNDDIYVMNADGSRIVNLTKSDEQEHGPVWSPDGKQIAYVVVQPEPPMDSIERGTTVTIQKTADIWVMNADGSQKRQLTRNTGKTSTAACPCWSPDGSSIAFSIASFAKDTPTSFRIYTMNINGANLKEIGQGACPVWSPNGKKMLYTAGNPELGKMQLGVMDSDGRNAQVLADKAGGGAWSPDGTKVVYATINAEAQETDLFMMNANGTQKVRLTKTKEMEISPQFSSDGRRLYFTVLFPMGEDDDENKRAIFTMDVNGKNKKRVTKDELNAVFGASNPSFPASMERF